MSKKVTKLYSFSARISATIENKKKKLFRGTGRFIFSVRMTTFHTSILDRGGEKNDDWGADLVRRICTFGDLQQMQYTMVIVE